MVQIEAIVLTTRQKQKEAFCHTLWCHQNMVKFLQNLHNRHPIASLWGWDIRIATNTPYLTFTDKLWGVCCDSNIWLAFCQCYHSVVCNILLFWHLTVFWTHVVLMIQLAWRYLRRIAFRGPFHEIFFQKIQIRWKFHSVLIHVVLKKIILKFCKLHDWCAVVTCARRYSNVMT